MRSPEEHPPIPNRGEAIALIGMNMLSLFDVLGKWDRASKEVMAHPTPENQKRFHQLDEIVRNLMVILPDFDHPRD